MSVEFKSRFLRKLSSLVSSGSCAVAVSGGVDSVVLMHLVAAFHKQNPSFLPTVLTVNHGFRPEACQEVNFVKMQAQSMGLKCYILSWEDAVHKKSQEVARAIRYKLLERWCEDNSHKILLTAHTKNDQAETLLLRLERGSGIDGLSGMKERFDTKTILIVRPLLDFTRNEIVEYAVQNNQTWIDDPSNSDIKYRRTFYRNLINAHSRSDIFINRLCRTTMHMQRSLHCILHYVSLAVDDCLEFSPWGHVIIKYKMFRNVHEEVARRLLLFLLMTIGNRPLKPRYQKFDSAFVKIWAGLCFSSFTLHGCKVLRDKENVIVAREIKQISPKTYVCNPSYMCWDGRFELCLDNTLHMLDIQLNIYNIFDGTAEAYKTLKNEEIPYIAPLGSHPIPDILKHENMNKYVVQGLPVLMLGDKVLAYPLQNHNICGIPVVGLGKVLLRERMVSLICSHLDL